MEKPSPEFISLEAAYKFRLNVECLDNCLIEATSCDTPLPLIESTPLLLLDMTSYGMPPLELDWYFLGVASS